MIRASLSRTSDWTRTSLTARAMLGDAARLPALSHHASECLIVGDGWRDVPEYVEALLDRVRFNGNGCERIGAVHLGARFVVGRPKNAGARR